MLCLSMAASSDGSDGPVFRPTGAVPTGFEALAAEHSDDGGTASRGGDLGVLTRSQLPGELGGAVFSMDVFIRGEMLVVPASDEAGTIMVKRYRLQPPS